MPIQTGQVSVGTAATRVLGTNGNFGHVILQNNDNTDAVSSKNGHVLSYLLQQL